MTNALFKTELAQEFWSKNSSLLSKYYHALVSFDFEFAILQAKELEKITEDYISETSDLLEDLFYDDMFICKTFCRFLAAYVNYWDTLLKENYPDSWNQLQDSIDDLRTLNKFSFIHKTIVFCFFEEQLQSLEVLYPYKIFASTEVITEKVDCSICKKDIESLECAHIQGELYRGQVAYGIVKKIKELLSVSLVENPCDKRCTIKEVDGKPMQFHCVEYLTKSLACHKFNPLMISHTIQNTRKEFVFTEKSPRNYKCPCGSGRKYKKCCLGKAIEKPHIEIILMPERNGFSNEELITMALPEEETIT